MVAGCADKALIINAVRKGTALSDEAVLSGSRRVVVVRSGSNVLTF